MPPDDEPRPAIRFIILALAVLAIVPYLQTLQHAFVNYDDNLYVTENRMVQQGLSIEGVKWAFTTFEGGNWHPLTWLSHMLDCSLFGLDAGKHHLVNVLLHAINTLLLFGLLLKMTNAQWRSALVAALFAVHPLHVESVAWVAERKDVLSTMFGLLAMLAYVRYARGGGAKPYVWMLVLFVVSLMCKPMLVTLPCLLLLLDIWPLRRWRVLGSDAESTLRKPRWNSENEFVRPFGRLLLEKLPLLAISAAFAVLAMISQNSAKAMSALDHLPVGARIANAVVAYVEYLNKLFVPTRLAVFYPHPGRIDPMKIALSAAILAAITLVVIVRRRQLWLPVGWLWFLGLLVPVIGLVQVGLQSMADRYMYLPAIGIFIMIAWSLPIAADEARSRVAAVASCLVVIALGLVTFVQTSHWRNSRTLFMQAQAVTVGNFMAHQNLGNAMERDGEIDAALEQYVKAVNIRPTYGKVHENVANILLQKGQFAGARQEIDVALTLDPESPTALNSLGVIYLTAKQPQAAVDVITKAVAIDPDNLEARGNLGAALMQVGRWNDAIAELNIVLKAYPQRHGIRTNRAMAMVNSGKRSEGIAELQEIIRIAPDFLPAQNALRSLMQPAASQLAAPTTPSAPPAPIGSNTDSR